MGFKDLAIGMVLVGLFAIALISFGINYGTDNLSDVTILNHSYVSGFNNSLYGELNNVKNNSQNQYQALSNQTLVSGGDDTFSLFALPKSVFKFIALGYGTIELVFNSMTSIIGIPLVFINVIAGALMIVLIIYAWRVIKAGGT